MRRPACLALVCGALLLSGPALGQDVQVAPFPPVAPDPVTIELSGAGQAVASNPLKVALGLTVLALLPALLVTATSFGRIVIVLGFVRVGLGTPNLPPNQVVLGLALALTALSMGPTLQRIHDDAIAPLLRDELDAAGALVRAEPPLRAHLLRHIRERDLATMLELARVERPEGAEELPLRVLLPAFITSELTTAFAMGVIVLVPFLVIDLVVASVLLAMNMMMLPPATIATPMKVLLFVLIDGWPLLARALVGPVGPT